MPYFESRLRANFADFNELKVKINFCEKLGIKNIILEPTNNINEISNELKDRLKNVTKINLFYRKNLKLNSINDFKKKIKNYSKFPDILSVESMNKEVQIHCARDSRVDILSFSDQKILKTITPGVLSLIKQNNSFIEFSLAPLFAKEKTKQSRYLRNLYRSLMMVRNKNLNYIISGNFDMMFNYRHPRGLISICHSLLGLSYSEAKKAFSLSPSLLIKRMYKDKRSELIEDDMSIIQTED